jgi:hypothetical protein
VKLWRNHRAGGDGRVFGDDHNAIPYGIERVINVTIDWERFDDYIIADAGVFIDNGAADLAVFTDTNRGAVPQRAIVIRAHQNRVFDY